MKPCVGRKPLTSRPFGPSTSIVPASPASAPERTKPARPRRESLAPCQTIMIGLRPARLERTPKAVRLTSTHIATPTTTAMAMIGGDSPAEVLIR